MKFKNNYNALSKSATNFNPYTRNNYKTNSHNNIIHSHENPKSKREKIKCIIMASFSTNIIFSALY